MRRPAPIPILLALTALALLGAANAQGNRPRPTDPFLIVSRQPVVELDLDTPPEAGRSVVGVAIGWSAINAQFYVSATTMLVITNLNKVLVIAYGILVLGETSTPQAIAGCTN